MVPDNHESVRKTLISKMPCRVFVLLTAVGGAVLPAPENLKSPPLSKMKNKNILRSFWLEIGCLAVAVYVMYTAMSQNEVGLTVRIAGFILGLPILALSLIVIMRALRALLIKFLKV
jgi:hypothetical protein